MGFRIFSYKLSQDHFLSWREFRKDEMVCGVLDCGSVDCYKKVLCFQNTKLVSWARRPLFISVWQARACNECRICFQQILFSTGWPVGFRIFSYKLSQDHFLSCGKFRKDEVVCGVVAWCVDCGNIYLEYFLCFNHLILNLSYNYSSILEKS